MSSVTSACSSPLATSYMGPTITHYPKTATDLKTYQAWQKKLTKAATAKGFTVTSYPEEAFQNLKTGLYIKDIDHTNAPEPKTRRQKSKTGITAKRTDRTNAKPYDRIVQRGLFANRKYKKGELVIPYEGVIMTQQQLAEKDQDTIRYLSPREFRPDHSDRAEEDWVVMTSKAVGLEGLKGVNLGWDADKKKFMILLDGYSDAQHTLAAPSLDVRIDAEIPFKGSSYLLGLGTFANSGDPEYGKDLPINTEYRVCPKTKQVILVTTAAVKKDEQFLASYKPEKFIIKKDDDKMWKEVGIISSS